MLVVRGEAGVGKTALLDYLVDSAADLRVLRLAGVESEMELAFAALHQLCGPVLDRRGDLPGPQRDALGTAFGLEAGPAPDRFLVGLAVLSLLSEVAAKRPLVCVIDDAQRLDRASAQALAFAARRLQAESVLMVFAMREPSVELRTLPELLVGGLRDADALELLGSVVPWPLDERVAERIVAETRGNPLALLELPRGRSPAELAGGFGLAEVLALPLPGRIEESFLRRVEGLPAQTRLLLVVAAAEPVGDPALVWRAARWLGLSIELSDYAEAAGLLKIGGRVVFRHPLVRSADCWPPRRRDRWMTSVGPGSMWSVPRSRIPRTGAAPVPPGPTRACDLLLDGLATQFTSGYAAGVPLLRRAVSAFRSKNISSRRSAGCGWPATPPGCCGMTSRGTS